VFIIQRNNNKQLSTV